MIQLPARGVPFTTQLPELGDGPVPDRPRTHAGCEQPHTPLRPMWCCRACGSAWPCPEARLRLKAEFERNMAGLAGYMFGLAALAARDLWQLNPHDGPTPHAVFERFVTWVPYQRPHL